jgi:hypothetical protein
LQTTAKKAQVQVKVLAPGYGVGVRGQIFTQYPQLGGGKTTPDSFTSPTLGNDPAMWVPPPQNHWGNYANTLNQNAMNLVQGLPYQPNDAATQANQAAATDNYWNFYYGSSASPAYQPTPAPSPVAPSYPMPYAPQAPQPQQQQNPTVINIYTAAKKKPKKLVPQVPQPQPQPQVQPQQPQPQPLQYPNYPYSNVPQFPVPSGYPGAPINPSYAYPFNNQQGFPPSTPRSPYPNYPFALPFNGPDQMPGNIQPSIPAQVFQQAG